MDVNDLIDIFKLRHGFISIEAKRGRDEVESDEVESGEPQSEPQAEPQAEQARRELEELKAVHESLVAVQRDAKSELDAFLRSVDAFRCDASEDAVASLRQLATHMHTSAGSEKGQFVMLLEFYRAHDAHVQGARNGLSEWEKLYTLLPSMADQAKEAYEALGFVPKDVPDAQQPLESPPESDSDAGDDVGDDDSADNDAAVETSSRMPSLGTHEELLDRCLEVLPNRSDAARARLDLEDHSMFSHSFDYGIANRHEGAAMQSMPYRRAYFYRNAHVEDEGPTSSSPSNRNGDLAAGLRAMVLWCVVVAADATSGCPLSVRLKTDPTSDVRYDATTNLIRDVHALLLQTEDAIASTSIRNRLGALTVLNHSTKRAATDATDATDATNGDGVMTRVEKLLDLSKQLASTLGAGTARDLTSPVVELMVGACRFAIVCLGLRHTAGLGVPGDASVVAFPTPTIEADDDDAIPMDAPEEDDAETETDDAASTVSEILPAELPLPPPEGDLMSFADQ